MRRLRPVPPRAKRRDAPAPPLAAKLSLQAFLPYRLNILAQVVSSGFSVAYSEKFRISAPEWRVLATLGEFKQMTAKDIGDHSGMHKATVSRAVLALEKHQLLTRSPSVADRREEILSLSAGGRQIYDMVVPMALRYERGLLEGLSRSDRANLDRLIRHLMNRANLPWMTNSASRPSMKNAKSPGNSTG